jgi:PLP dependent protein
MYDERLRRNLPRVEERVAAAKARAGREGAVRLVAVTKGHGVEAVRAAWSAGIRDVGENRVQELEEKRAAFDAAAPAAAGGERPAWHLIGHLQRNKVRRALPLFDLIHSVDSLRLARELSKEAVRAGAQVQALVQVNVSGEATKGGFDASRVVDDIAAVACLPALAVRGLMTMAPFTDDELEIRRTFTATRELLERCAVAGIALSGRELSMGMSSDYEIAIEEGSTMIRLGTILFGEREQ